MQGRRMSQRSAAKRVKYDVDISDEDASGGDEDAEEDDAGGGGLQKLKRQSSVPEEAGNNRLQTSQDARASEREAEPVGSAAGMALAGRRQSMTATGNGHLESVPEEAEEAAADEPEMTQKSTRRGSQKAQKEEV